MHHRLHFLQHCQGTNIIQKLDLYTHISIDLQRKGDPSYERHFYARREASRYIFEDRYEKRREASRFIFEDKDDVSSGSKPILAQLENLEKSRNILLDSVPDKKNSKTLPVNEKMDELIQKVDSKKSSEEVRNFWMPNIRSNKEIAEELIRNIKKELSKKGNVEEGTIRILVWKLENVLQDGVNL